MSRITKDLAKEIAKQLTVKTKINMMLLEQQYQQIVTDLFWDAIPEEIKKCYEKYPVFFDTNKSITFSGYGFKYTTVNSIGIVIQNESMKSWLHLNEKIAVKISKAKIKFEKTKEVYENLLSETENALLALRTYKNIESTIPAAKPFLPPPISNSLVVNFESLNRKINNQPEIKTDLQNV